MSMTPLASMVGGVVMEGSGTVEEAIAQFPWPAQLGIVGALILWNILTIRAQNQRVQKGDLVPRASHEEALAAAQKKYDEMIVLKDERTTAEAEAKKEWRTAHATSETARAEERAINAKNAETLRYAGHFFDSFTPEGDKPPTSGDNGAVKEAAK